MLLTLVRAQQNIVQTKNSFLLKIQNGLSLKREALMDLQKTQEVLNLMVKHHKSQLSMHGIVKVWERLLILRQRTLDQVLMMLTKQTVRLKLEVMKHLLESLTLQID